MIGTLTGLQWWIYDSFKTAVGLATTGGGSKKHWFANKYSIFNTSLINILTFKWINLINEYYFRFIRN